MGSIYGFLSTSELGLSGKLIDHQRNASNCLNASSSACSGYNNSSALGGHDNPNAPPFFTSEKLLVIVDGNPIWTDQHLSSIATSRNAAHALAEGFLLHGRSILNKIRGPFAFCIIEPEQRYALLAIDRLGIKPLALYLKNDLLVFGSQIVQILGHPNVIASIDPQALYNYLYFHMSPSPGSVYKSISKLQPGEFFEIANGKTTRDFYWQLPYIENKLSKKDLLVQLQPQLERSINQYCLDSYTGTFLSGGLDSSTVTGIYQKMAKHQIDAFTMGFEADGYDETEYARAAARHFKVNLHEYYVTPADVLKAIPLIAKTYDEPFGNASAIPTYYCAKFAKEHGMNQLLAGDGGDEIFAGNARYAKQKLFNLYRHCPGILKSLIEPIAYKLHPLRKVKSYIEQAKIAMPERMETYNFLHRTPLDEIFQHEFLKQIDPTLPLQYLTSTYNRSPSDDLIKKMLFLDGKFTLADNDLRKVNRMCELAGIKVHYPMLNENLVEFAASIPSEWLMQGFELRSFYREALKNFLPKETLNKNKQGFGLPFGVWMSSDKELKQFAEANLESIKKRDFLNPTYITKLIQLHQQGHSSYYGVMIWILVMLEQWLISHDH
ncbi:MAG: asparagine synthase [Methylococcaceae bacterium]|nr:asparagine synthase [Methylococcaceae bacterium]